MNILLTNDDGIFREGLVCLKKALSEMGKVYVVAPDGERSSISHAITLNHPLRINKVDLEGEPLGFSSTGTPADCVILGLKGLLGDVKIDYIVSGINYGLNLGEDVIYSGTVSAALEGGIYNIPSFAFSKQTKDNSLSFCTAASLSSRIVNFFIKNLKTSNYVFNVNFPDLELEKIKGLKITRLGRRIYYDRLEKRIDPRGKIYYWIGGDEPSGKMEEGTDILAVHEGYVSITPLSLNFVDLNLIDALKKDIGEFIPLREV